MYSLDFPILNQSVAPCQVLTAALDLPTDFSGGRSGVWYSHLLKNFPVCCDWGQEEKEMTEDEMAGWHH